MCGIFNHHKLTHKMNFRSFIRCIAAYLEVEWCCRLMDNRVARGLKALLPTYRCGFFFPAVSSGRFFDHLLFKAQPALFDEYEMGSFLPNTGIRSAYASI